MDRLIKYILAILSFTLCSLNTYCQNWLGIEKRTDKAKVVWTKRITKYNPNNHEAELISTEKYNEKGFKTFIHDPFDEEYIYKYDNNDNIVEILNYEPGDDTLTAKQKFTYDKNNKLVEECVYRHDILESRNTYSYDEKGNRTEFIVYSEDNKVLQHFSYKYNSKNNIIKEKIFEFGEDKGTRTYKYNKDNNITECVSKDKDGNLVFKSTNSYDKNNNLTENCFYNSEGKVTNKTVQKFDENNNIIETNSFNENGELTTRSTYKFDNNKNIIENCQYNSKGDLTKKVVRKYNDNNKLLDVCYYNSDGSVSSRSTNTYYDNGILKETIDTSLYCKSVKKYNEIGQITEDIRYDKNNNLERKSTFKYNDRGSCVETITFEGTESSFSESLFFEYEYYK